MSAPLRNLGKLGIQLCNANSESKMISQKMGLVGVLLYSDLEVEWDKEVKIVLSSAVLSYLPMSMLYCCGWPIHRI